MTVERTTAADIAHPLDPLTLDELQTLQDSLAAVGGLHVSLGTPAGQPLTHPLPLPPVCRLLRQAACREPDPLCIFSNSHWRQILAEGQGAVLACCPLLDLQMAAVPLRVHDQALATLVCGRVLQAAPEDAWLRQKAHGLRIDEAQLRAALQEMPVIGGPRFRDLVAHAEMMVQTLARLAEARLAGQQAGRTLQVTNRRLGALGVIAASVIRSTTWQESLGEALQTILEVLRLESGAIFLQGEEGGPARLVAHRGVGPEFVALADSELLADVAGGGLLLESREPWAVTDVTKEPELAIPFLRRLQIAAFVVAPLRAAESTLGTLLVYASRPRAFQPDEVALIAAAGEQLGIGVQGLRLLAAEKRRAGQLAILNQVAVAVGASLDLQVIVEQGLEAVLRLFRADAGLVYLLDDGAEEPVLVAHRGLSAATADCWAAQPPVGWDPAQGIEGRARWGSNLAEACARPDLALSESLVSYLSAPLRGQRGMGGLLVAFTREPRALLANEVELFQAVAHEIGLAVENARLYREAQHRLAELEALQQFNERILHAMQEGIFIINTHGKVSYATPSLVELSGYPLEELLGKDWSAFARVEARDELQQNLDLFVVGQSVRLEVDLVRKDGEIRHVSVGEVPLFDGDELAGVLGVVTDLTEEVQLRRRLRQAEKLSAVGELVSGVAHELNNPLTVIRGYAQLLRGQEGGGATDRELQAITEHAERAAHIVQGLLAFARERPPARDLVDLNAVVQSVLDMCRSQMDAAHIQVSCELAPDLPKLRGEPYELQEVFLNILLNAQQALAEKGSGGEIAIRTAALPDESVLATVQDDGPGIPAAVAHRIFDPFFTTKSNRQGTGLGLSICYGIVSAHGGRIWAESVEGQGAIFFVSLPVSGPKPAQAKVLPTFAGERAPSGRSRILVLEDEVEIAQLEARYLERLGYQVTVAHEGRAALSAAGQQDFDLILTDLKMPGMSGQEFYAHLCSAKPHLAERVVFVTGDSVSPETRSFLSQTGRSHLAKPFSLDEMHGLISTVLQASEASGS